MKLLSFTLLLFIDYISLLGQPITGTGTANNLSKFTSATAIGSSIIYDNGINVGIGSGYSDGILNLNGLGTNANGSVDIMMLLSNKKYNSSSSSGENKIVFGWANHWAAGISAFKATYNTTGFKIYTENGYNVPLQVLTILPWGPVGIGTSSPVSMLDVNGGITTQTLQVNGVGIFTGNIYTNNKILIGTSSLPPATYAPYSLVVNGFALFTKAVVKSSSNWPDYVFNTTYKLLPIHELESFLLKNKHLPDMPSASVVEKNGIDLGENQTILLKKIEELTLYVIEINKKNVDMQKQINKLKTRKPLRKR